MPPTCVAASGTLGASALGFPVATVAPACAEVLGVLGVSRCGWGFPISVKNKVFLSVSAGPGDRISFFDGALLGILGVPALGFSAATVAPACAEVLSVLDASLSNLGFPKSVENKVFLSISAGAGDSISFFNGEPSGILAKSKLGVKPRAASLIGGRIQVSIG